MSAPHSKLTISLLIGFVALSATNGVQSAQTGNSTSRHPASAHATLQLDGRIGETRELESMPVARAHWGGNSSSQDEFVYEPPPGWIILSYKVKEESKYGDSWYTPQLTAKGSNYAAETKFSQALEDLEKYAGKYNDKKAEQELNNVRHNSTNWQSTFRSTNNVLRIKWGGTSREKKAGPVVVDTDTASLSLSVVITIARSLSEAELQTLVSVLKEKIRRGQSISEYFAT